ncbi:MAG: rod shape-determining protein [Candidatus Woykebacteria bacterium RIFCSPHIGHO2_12_FULL_45_10]|uniref:Cell shape-determining protein MreB n=1 Tax=Candidatus Woykebacteria bacterium RIFCSPHIGHO2_12_FULL_45_10 TaxID=1802603 RepID=A0A1G1WPC2_9BACT|nr:MAG: rod shape-determining protein [Candidatus Woykebacteria bacterium RIFCSPHIGHO2_12_FULL_45_10]
MYLIDAILGQISHDISIDLGTANTLVLVRGKGIMVREPTVIAQHRKTKRFVAAGTEAKRMLGKTPVNIVAIRPLKDGVISDLEAAEALLKYFIKKVHAGGNSGLPKIPRPRVVIGIPSGVTEVERRAVQDAALKAGAREVFLLEEPMAAAIGAKLPIDEPRGSMVVDIGGGTTEIAVISLGGMVLSRSIRVAGDEMDQDIINYARSRYNLLLGERTAEEIKINAGSAAPGKSEGKIPMRGRDLETGLPTTIFINTGEVREAISPTVHSIIEAVKDTIEETPPELIGDILDSGVTLVGGGALLPGFAETLEKEVKMPVNLVDDPLTTVVRGAGRVLENRDLLKAVKISGSLR